MDFGTRTIRESYYKGELRKKVTMSIPILIHGEDDKERKAQCLSEIMKALDLISNGQTHELTLTIKANKDHQFNLLTKCYEID